MDVAQARAQDLDQADAFAAAVLPCLPLMDRLAARLAPRGTAEDVVQESLLRAWANRIKYDADRGTLLTWLLTIVAREARRASRRRRLNVRP